MNIRNVWLKTYTEWRYRALLHTCFWLFILLITSNSKIYSLRMQFVGIGVSTIAYYLLVYAVLPLYFKRRFVIAIPISVFYLLVIVIIITFLYSMLIAEYHTFMASHGFPRNLEIDPRQFDLNLATDAWYGLFGLYIAILSPPLIAKSFREIYKQQTKALTLEKENILLELNFLKSQVNPHFLFNTLNNIQSFIVNNEPEKSLNLIGRLSQLMRFSLYETGKDLISLNKELEIIQNYVELERVRCEDRVAIEYTISENGKEFLIPPYILVPFVENAFKHGANNSVGKSFVNIDIKIRNESLLFEIANSFEKNADSLHFDEGIGLKNVKKRLEHYFKEEYYLQISKEKGVFFVKLEIRQLKVVN